MLMKKRRVGRILRDTLLGVVALCAAAGFVLTGVFLLWASTLSLPTIDIVEARRDEQATRIYDKTGEVLLYDMHQDVKRTIVPLEDISWHVRNATIAIEDDRFYSHYGVDPIAIVRAVVTNLQAGDLLGGQGGSTLTQQVVKNALLNPEKKITRKVKEWVLAIKLEQEASKEEILEMYLNEVPYGGNKYGVEEASQAFFGKPARDLNVVESAYLAALPQAPTYYSPYGAHRDDLEYRKNVVLARMNEQGFLSDDDYAIALETPVEFRPSQATGIKAPHFVFYVIDELTKKYGEGLAEAGYTVITTLDWELQKAGESIVFDHAHENDEKFNASNASLMAVDPKTGGIITMVGSRDYFDEDIDGAFNIGLASRQPGSSFKPFAYATALAKGYTTETVVFDVRTQFSTACSRTDLTSENGCYAPGNYDNIFRGPMTFRDALAQSVNVPAVKALYLAGMRDTIELTQRMGISTLTDWQRYGLTLVLGGGEVSLLEMTSAYGVFANEGVRHAHYGVERVEDQSGNTVYEHERHPSQVIDRDIALQITDMLADNEARTPAFGAQSFLHFPGRDVAAKTGTTNDYRDAWIIGYSPDIAVGAWAGNNDNSAMEKKVAGFIIAPLWNKYLQAYFELYPEKSRFSSPPSLDASLKPVLRGRYEGANSVVIDKGSGQLANDDTPSEMREELFIPDIHSILHWVDKDDPRGPIPSNPGNDGQYHYWEYGVLIWSAAQGAFGEDDDTAFPTEVSDIRDDNNKPRVHIRSPRDGARIRDNRTVSVRLDVEGTFPIKRADYYINNQLLGSVSEEPYSMSFVPEDVPGIQDENTLMVIVYDEILNQSSDVIEFEVR
jgi:1A family penicillin-binding protein